MHLRMLVAGFHGAAPTAPRPWWSGAAAAGAAGGRGVDAADPRVRDGAANTGHDVGGLLIVGVPTEEPWHLTAHLDDQARLAREPQLAPVLVRHRVPPGARRTWPWA